MEEQKLYIEHIYRDEIKLLLLLYYYYYIGETNTTKLDQMHVVE